jgi:hypothetical protein
MKKQVTIVAYGCSICADDDVVVGLESYKETNGVRQRTLLLLLLLLLTWSSLPSQCLAVHVWYRDRLVPIVDIHFVGKHGMAYG